MTRVRKILILFFFMGCLSGCWDVEEVDHRDFVKAIGLDAVSNSVIRVTSQIVLPDYILPPAAGVGSKSKKFYSIFAESHTVLEAIAKQQTKSSRSLHIGRVRSILLHEVIARQGIKKYLDYLSRTPKLPTDAIIFICREPAGELLKRVPAQETIPGLAFNQQMDSIEKQDRTYPMPIWRFLQRLDEPGEDPYAPVLAYSKKEQVFTIENLAVFRHECLAGFLNPAQTRNFGMITGKIKEGYLEVPLNMNEFAAFRSVIAHSRITVKGSAQAPSFLVKISASGSLNELVGVSRILDIKSLQKIERRTEEYIQTMSRRTISLLQSWEADILDFGLEYRLRYPRQFKPQTWRKIFRRAKVEVRVDFKIVNTGLYH
jgi:spore germination protein KC